MRLSRDAVRWLIGCLGLVVGADALAQAPAITSFSPVAIRPGATTTVKIRGSHLAGATQLWVSSGAQTQVVPPTTNAGEVTYHVTLPSEAPLGLCGARVTTPQGVSGMKLLVVDDLPTVVQVRGNHTAQAAQAVPLPVAIDGYIASLTRDYYRFTVSPGQRVSIEVLAQRLGSPLDAMFRILDKKGRELTYADDTPGAGSDPQLSYVFKDGGEYLLEIRDVRYQGSEQAVYRLRIGDFPCVTAAYPMGIKRGIGSSISFVGINGTDAVPVAANLTAQDMTGWLSVAAKLPGGQSSGFATVSVSNRDEVLEAEPNDGPKEATRVPLGANLNGRFQKSNDTDRFVFTAKANQHFVFTGVTRSQGSPSDLYLRILKADGTEMASAEDNGPLEGKLDVTFPADGDYTLVVEELNRKGGPESSYHIDVRPFENRFTLTASADVVNVPQGGAATLQINAARGPFSGPIMLSLADAPAGITAAPAVIDANQTQVVMVLQAAPGTATGVLHNVKVIGKSMLNGVESQAVASIGDSLKTAFNGLIPPPSITDSLALGLQPAAPFTVKCDVAEITFGRNLTASAKVKVTRSKDYNEEIAIALLPVRKTLPQTLAVNLKPIAKGTDEIAFTVSADDAVALGDYTLLLSGTAKKGEVSTTQPLLMPVRLHVREPFALQVNSLSGPLSRGQALKVHVNAKRNPAYRGPIVLNVQNLPKGVTAAPVTIPPEQDSIYVNLTAAADAMVGTIGNVVIQGSGTGEKGKAVTAAAPAVPLTVK